MIPRQRSQVASHGKLNVNKIDQKKDLCSLQTYYCCVSGSFQCTIENPVEFRRWGTKNAYGVRQVQRFGTTSLDKSFVSFRRAEAIPTEAPDFVRTTDIFRAPFHITCVGPFVGMSYFCLYLFTHVAGITLPLTFYKK